jgi:hypothetical protein
MLLAELEYLSAGLGCFRQSWNAIDSDGFPLYRVEVLYSGLECFLECWNAFDRVGMLSTELEYLCNW